MTAVFSPQAAQAAADKMKRATDEWCAEIAELIEACVPPGFNLQLTCTIRGGKVRLHPQPVYKSPGWRDESSNGG